MLRRVRASSQRPCGVVTMWAMATTRVTRVERMHAPRDARASPARREPRSRFAGGARA
jgi:hypothetical protein